MKFVSFNPFRSIGFHNTTYIKAENMFQEEEKIKSASILLFPEYWQVNSLVYGWKKNIFPSISTYHLGHDKIEMTRLFQAIVPEYMPYTKIIGYTPEANQRVIREKILSDFSFPFIAKKTRSSEGKGVYLITNMADLNQYLQENTILYIQEYLPITRDLRVVLIGDRVFSAYWRIGQEGNFKNNLAQGGQISYENIPEKAVELVERIAGETGINHAGFDIAVFEDRLYLLEFNVFFGNMGLAGKSKEINNAIYRYLIDQLTSSHPASMPYTRVP
ncbi:MAG: RimK family alpha-L-glutamate ligase [Halanaerobiales bacterium]